MDITNKFINCPRCFSDNLYKYGKDKDGNQKYQCKECKRQFAPDAKPKQTSSSKGYPRCPVCGMGTYLHHDYKYYSYFTCNDKKCNNHIYIPKPTAIDNDSSATLYGKLDFNGMRFPKHIIITALNIYFDGNTSTRAVSNLIQKIYNVKVSHVTIAAWTKKFAPYFQAKQQMFIKHINVDGSDEWHVDETVVFINGIRHYIWFVIDSETRFVISYHLSRSRNSSQAFKVLNAAKAFGDPQAIVSDRLASYNKAVKSIDNKSNHIRVESFKDDISNNLLESFNDTFKSFYKAKRGFGNFSCANNLIFTFVYHYNFLKPHSSLNALTPAEVAGASFKEHEKNNWLIAA